MVSRHRRLIVFLGFLSLSSSLLAQGSSPPQFEDYPAGVYKGERVAPRVGIGEARTFRTMLRQGAKDGINFAGHYTVVFWGCGAGCLIVGIIDVKTGTVYFPKELNGFGVWYWDKNMEALQFKPRSRLIIMSGYPATEMDRTVPACGLYYYEWTGQALKVIQRLSRNCDRP
jgi:hypothetical protein